MRAGAALSCYLKGVSAVLQVVCAIALGILVAGYAVATAASLIPAPVSAALSMPLLLTPQYPSIQPLVTVACPFVLLVVQWLRLAGKREESSPSSPSNYLVFAAIIVVCLLGNIEPLIAAILVIAIIDKILPTVIQTFLTPRTYKSLQRLVEVGCDPLMVVDHEGTIIAANQTVTTLLGSSLVGHPIDRYLPTVRGEGQGDIRSLDGRVLEIQARLESSAACPVEVAIGLVPDRRFDFALVRVSDISTRAERQEELERLALHDSLTGLPNRLLLHDRIRQSIARAEREGGMLAVMLLDLDRFKSINDTLGHHIGDALLQAVGPRLAMPLRRSDTLARLGGDEFAILLPPPIGLETALEVAQRIDESVRTPFQVEGMSLDIGVSLGIALFPDHGTDLNTLLQNADDAMYRAKRAKLGYCVYDSEITYGNARRLELQRDMRAAMDSGQIDLLFQPQIDAKSGKTIGAEALIRWAHPEYGVLSPNDFLPIADQTGMILPMTLVVLNRCLETQRRLREAGLDIALSVNLSPKWLDDERFPRILRLIVSSWQGKAAGLTIEVPESSVMIDPERTKKVLSELAEIGVRLSLDDFGAGYSSLQLLQRLPIHELKIHRGFIADMDEDKDTEIVVRSIVRLAHGLGLQVVGEGVETAEAMETLRTLGCDRLQGFYLARPMESERLVKWAWQRELVPDED